jgi:peptide deformylase
VDDFITCTFFVALPASATSARDEELLNYKYSDTWTGTALPLLDLSQASQIPNWDMARWPDAILRRPASPVDSSYFGTDSLRRATELLRETSQNAGAVGLAAQQCGIDARLIYLEPQMAMVNPRIIRRSDERDMRVWQEQCLVLPPTFCATVLRDAWIDVEYNDWKGAVHKKRLRGELARAAQHELDHDRGILVLDHVDMNEMENAKMRAIEQNGHELRMALAYSRTIDEQHNTMA